MKEKTAGFALAILLATGGAVSAAITQYECRFSQETAQGGGWIPEMLVLTENSQTGEILAYDPIIEHFIGNPIPARLSAETKVRKTFVWELTTRNEGQTARRKYTFSYFSNGQPSKMRSQAGSYDNSWTGEGSCTVSTQ